LRLAVSGEISVSKLDNQGTINSIFLITVSDHNSTTNERKNKKFILKIINSKWNTKKTVNEVQSMLYINYNASHIPIPKLHCWEENKEESEIKYEFILMEYLEVLNHFLFVGFFLSLSRLGN
jgi:hypothetical protein